MIDTLRRAKITWRCRRGMLELDLIFQQFIEQYLDKLTQAEVLNFEALLKLPDPDLFSYLMGTELIENEELHHIITLIQLHSGVRSLK